jgi:hypothetical protein
VQTTNPELGQQLHDQATRGHPLDAAQTAQLDTWYAQQDAAEQVTLAQAAESGDLATLREQVNRALGQLEVSTHRVRQLAAENETLRSEFAALRRDVANKSVPQAA